MAKERTWREIATDLAENAGRLQRSMSVTNKVGYTNNLNRLRDEAKKKKAKEDKAKKT